MSSQAIPQPGAMVDPTSVTAVLLIRHGRSADVVPGSEESQDPPLHEIGVEQAAALDQRLEKLPIDAVYSSDLRRAADTAKPLADRRGLSVTQLADLREVWLGDWERGEFRRRAFERDPEWLEFARTGRWDLVPNSEGDEALRARVSRTVNRIASAHIGQTVAVVAHGGVINAYVAAAYNLDRTYFAAIENTSVTVVHVREGIPFLVALNSCDHLYDPVFGPTAPTT